MRELCFCVCFLQLGQMEAGSYLVNRVNIWYYISVCLFLEVLKCFTFVNIKGDKFVLCVTCI